MSTPDLIPVPNQDPIDIADDAEIGDVRTALKSLSDKYESLKNILAQNINRLSLSTGAKKKASTLLKQPDTRREDYSLKAGLEVGMRTTTTVGAKFCRLAVGPHVIEKKWGTTEAGMRTESGRGLRRTLPGTITVAATTVTGVGTQFTRDFFIGDEIAVYNGEFPASTNAVVTAIASDTSMTIQTTMTVATASAYKRNGHDTNPPFSLECTYTNGTTVGLNKLDQAFVDFTGQVHIIAGALTTVSGVASNLLLQSHTFQTTWTAENVTITANTAETLDPAGTNLADIMVDAATNTRHDVYQSVTKTASAPMVLSCYFKKKSYDYAFLEVGDGGTTNFIRQYFKISDGTVGTASAGAGGYTKTSAAVASVGNGWYRCSLVVGTPAATSAYAFVGSASADNSLTYAGDVNKGVYVYGGMLSDDTTTLLTYAPTTTAVVYATSFTREYRIGDQILINSSTTQMRRITAVTNDYTMTIAANGTATPGVSHQKRSWLAIHVVTNETGNKIGMVLSKFSHNPKMPPGFSYSRRVGWVRFMDTTGNTEVFARFVYDGEEDIVWWNEDLTTLTSPFQVGNGLAATANTWTAVPGCGAIPPTSRHSKSTCYVDPAAGVAPSVAFKNEGQTNIPNAAMTNAFLWGFSSTNEDIAFPEDIPVSPDQTFMFMTNDAGNRVYVKVWGYQDII